MKVQVNDPSLVEDLAETLRKSQLVVARTGPSELEVRFPWPLREDAASLELDLYLRVWEATHEDAHAVRVG
jgi:hypothetical protein